MSSALLKSFAQRRSIYQLGKKLPKSTKEVAEEIQMAIRLCPSSFHAQSSRALILFNTEHEKMWDIVKTELKRVTSAEQFVQTEAKVNHCFAAGAGTVVFYEDGDIIKGQQKTFPTYAKNFPAWAQHSSAIAQFAVWTALSEDGIGASLQHYNELIDPKLREAFDIPAQWELIAQMPFGSIEKAAAPKTFIPDKDRFMVQGL